MQTFGLNYDVKPECTEDFKKNFVKSDTFQTALKEAVGMLESKPSHFAGQDIRLIKSAE